MSTLVDTVALSLTPPSWRRNIGDRLRALEAPGAILQSIVPADETAREAFDRLPGRARRALDRAARSGIVPLTWTDPLYPPSLAAIYDPPPLLWIRGDGAAIARPAVAIVGSRAGSPYALTIAERLAGDLAARGVLVVSGLARGVDSAAHRGALVAAGRTVAVLGSGVDVIYPPEHVSLAASITESGALVSELAPGTRPLQWFFPMRNRIISGLARAVVVIEAGQKSGSLITARCALDQGRDVLAVPGSVIGGRNRGSHALLRDGAKIVESADDILDELNLHTGFKASQGGPAPVQHSESDPVLASLAPGEACDLEAISARCGLQTAHLLQRLLELELQGIVRRVGGGRFIRLDRSC